MLNIYRKAIIKKKYLILTFNFGIIIINLKVIKFRRRSKAIMTSKDIIIKNSVGLHARPATFFIQKANTYKSSIWVECGDRRANAKSLLGVLSLAIVNGTKVTLIADGPDEVEALDGLCALIDSGFDER